jgi:hypothetical protein
MLLQDDLIPTGLGMTPFRATALAVHDLNVPDATAISRQYHVCIQHAQGLWDDADEI